MDEPPLINSQLLDRQLRTMPLLHFPSIRSKARKCPTSWCAAVFLHNSDLVPVPYIGVFRLIAAGFRWCSRLRVVPPALRVKGLNYPISSSKYKQYVIGHFDRLRYLDDQPVATIERIKCVKEEPSFMELLREDMRDMFHDIRGVLKIKVNRKLNAIV
ncbi:hypothetical protein AVEN_264834-1 [Araneus ventricosus]|uniref:Uncharacterized protein n=1 Tax=Araneus ventricosus TaxID=182803 RepID=A0A4Y2DXC2_ARAVE|nr:hypothetical protein AVEN_264834-1 [Araneus ventricosus]